MLDMDDIADVIASAIRENTAPLVARIEELEREVEQVKSKGLIYRGVWQRASDYERGAIVTFNGTAWVATKAIADGEEPGKGAAWQLMLKAGR